MQSKIQPATESSSNPNVKEPLDVKEFLDYLRLFHFSLLLITVALICRLADHVPHWPCASAVNGVL